MERTLEEIEKDLDQLYLDCCSSEDSDYNQSGDSQEDSDSDEEFYNQTMDIKDYKINWQVPPKKYIANKEIKFIEENIGPQNTENFIDTDFIDLYYSDTYLKKVLEYTNKYIKDKQLDEKSKYLQRKSARLGIQLNHQKQQEEIRLDEIKTVLGISYLFGLVQKPQIKSYWEDSQLFSIVGIQQIMKRDRFLYIYDNICFYDIHQQNKDNKRFFQVMEIIDHLQTVTQMNYNPNRHLSPDELMIKYSGYDSDKQYMPSKPIRFGYKVQALCDGITGVLLKILPYSKQNYDKDSNTPFSQRVIVDLCSDYYDKGHILYTDGIYTSPSLFLQLKIEFGLNCVGSYAQNRLHSNDNAFYKNEFKKIKENEVKFYIDKGYKKLPLILSVTKQSYKKPMRILSTFHSPLTSNLKKTMDKKERCRIQEGKMQEELTQEQKEQLEQYDRSTKESYKKNITVSQQQKDYNKYMGGVDHFDQLMSYYMPQQRGYRKYFRIIQAVKEMILLNSYLLYRETQKKLKKNYMSLYNYKKLIIRHLVQQTRQINDIDPTPLKQQKIQQQNKVNKNKIDSKKLFGFGYLQQSKKCKIQCIYCTSRQKWGCLYCKKYVCKQCEYLHVHLN